MRLDKSGWQEAWHEQGLSERFFMEISRLDKTEAAGLSTGGQWLSQLVAEIGHLAQSMAPLEAADPGVSHLRLSYEKAVKVSALASLLAGALEQTQKNNLKQKAFSHGDFAPGSAFSAAVERASQAAGSPRQEAESTREESAEEKKPVREMIKSLSHRGVSIPEIEAITGQPRRIIEAVLAGF